MSRPPSKVAPGNFTMLQMRPGPAYVPNAEAEHECLGTCGIFTFIRLKKLSPSSVVHREYRRQKTEDGGKPAVSEFHSAVLLVRFNLRKNEMKDGECPAHHRPNAAGVE